jgi:hypothetical protein
VFAPKPLSCCTSPDRLEDIRLEHLLPVGASRPPSESSTLSASESESGLELLDEAANKRASLATGENDAPFPAMTGKEGHVTVHLGYFEADGGPALSLSDQEGHVRAELGSTELVTPKTGATRRTAEASLSSSTGKTT